MLMNFSSKRKGVHGSAVFCPGRTGHRVATINDSILVVGGTDKSGRFVDQVHRINCLNLRIDALVVENTLAAEGFSLFAFQEAFFIWGGARLGQHTNLLLQFDGNKFAPLPQHGPVPSARAYHAYSTFAGKYLIIFGGYDGVSFLTDWHLLNLKTLEWRPLQADFPVRAGLSSCMVWTNGRGILLVNQTFEQASRTIIPNSFYEFYVKDFNRGLLKVLPIHLPPPSLLQDYVFTRMAVADHASHSILLLGGYKFGAPTQLHGVSVLLSLEQMRVQKSKFRLRERCQFEAVYHRNKLFVIGGIGSKDFLEESVQVFENITEKSNYKRQVCHMCKLYFDEEWFRNSKEAFPAVRVKEDYDYNYHLKMDTRVLAKLSTQIPSQLYALTLIIQSLQNFDASLIEVSFHRAKENGSTALMPEGQGMDSHRIVPQREAHHFLKIGCLLREAERGVLINHLLMREERELQLQQGQMGEFGDGTEVGALRVKLGSLRIGRSCIFSMRVSKEEVCVIYLSCNQLECAFSAFHPSPTHYYYYNTKTKQYSSQINSHIVHENVRPVISDYSHFQELGDRSMSILVLCRDEIGSQLSILEHNEQVETGETCAAQFVKDENRKDMPLLQFSFLQPPACSILIEQTTLAFLNILTLLHGDARSKVLQRIDRYDHLLSTPLFQQIELFHFPSEYRFRTVLVYHSNRLIMHFEEPELDICGAIVLRPTVELDLSGSHPQSVVQELKLKEIVMDFKSLKRRHPIFE